MRPPLLETVVDPLRVTDQRAVFMGFANDNNNRLPGQLTLGGLKFQFGTEDSKCTHAIFSLQATKSNSMPLNKATEINCLGFVGGNIK